VTLPTPNGRDLQQSNQGHDLQLPYQRDARASRHWEAETLRALAPGLISQDSNQRTGTGSGVVVMPARCMVATLASRSGSVRMGFWLRPGTVRSRSRRPAPGPTVSACSGLTCRLGGGRGSRWPAGPPGPAMQLDPNIVMGYWCRMRSQDQSVRGREITLPG